jgi:hypothetical protein
MIFPRLGGGKGTAIPCDALLRVLYEYGFVPLSLVDPALAADSVRALPEAVYFERLRKSCFVVGTEGEVPLLWCSIDVVSSGKPRIGAGEWRSEGPRAPGAPAV